MESILSKQLFAVEYITDEGGRGRVEVPASDAAAALGVVLDEQDDVDEGRPVWVCPAPLDVPTGTTDEAVQRAAELLRRIGVDGTRS